MAKLYKNKYLIGIYNKEGETQTDDCIFIGNSVQELADYLKCSLNCARAILSNHQKRGTPDILVANKLRELHLIDVTED